MQNNNANNTYPPTYQATAQITIAVVAIYIAASSAIFIYLLQKGNISLYGYVSVVSCMLSVVLLLFSGDFLQSAVFNPDTSVPFNYLHNLLYAYGQSLFFVGTGFFIRTLSFSFSVIFLELVIICHGIFYLMRFKYIKTNYYRRSKKYVRASLFVLYFISLYFIIFMKPYYG